jgi:predicted AAA+ superfamily ATPase
MSIFHGILMKRPYFLNKISTLNKQFPALCLVGPRQVGKTTLAKMYAEQIKNDISVHRFDLEDPEDLEILAQPKLALQQLEGLIIIDEVQFKPNLFPILRVLIDTPKVPQKWLILGSSSRDLLNQSSETLAGRIAYLEIQPFSYLETQEMENLWMRGGFPGSYLAQSNDDSLEWRKQYIKTFLEQDIPNLGIRIESLELRRFWMMLAHYHGNILNMEELSRSMGIPNRIIRKYLDILSSTFMIRQLQPWWENISKRQVKSPKIYIRDSGLLNFLLNIENRESLLRHPKLGSTWEGFALEQIIRCHHFDAENCYFWASHQQAELDLLVFHQGKRLGFEFKYADAPKLTKSMKIVYEDLKLDQLFVIYPGEKNYFISENIQVISLKDFPKQ